MIDWVLDPKGKLKEHSERKKQERDEERKKHVGKGRLFDYPQDTFFTRPIYKPWLIIPKGYVGVRERIGMIGKVLQSDPQADGHELDDSGELVKNYRDLPGGGLVEPGLRFMISAKGLWSRMAVVDGRSRTENIELPNVITEVGTVELPRVVATLNWRVIDPVRAMTGVRNYYKTAMEMAQVRIRDAFAPRTLEEIAGLREEHRNLSPLKDEDGNKALIKAGLKFDGLYITDYDLPDKLEEAFAAEVIGRERAQGLRKLADIGRETAKLDDEAGAIYTRNAGAREILRLRTAADPANKGVTYRPDIAQIGEGIAYGATKIAEAIAEAVNRKP